MQICRDFQNEQTLAKKGETYISADGIPYTVESNRKMDKKSRFANTAVVWHGNVVSAFTTDLSEDNANGTQVVDGKKVKVHWATMRNDEFVQKFIRG